MNAVNLLDKPVDCPFSPLARDASTPCGRAGPPNAQSRGSRQPVRFGGTPKVHRHRLAEPYRCATGGLRRARPVRELWLLRRRLKRLGEMVLPG
eukprot:scaffold66921_cov75-Phaeocystis_antarctica.AAC.1